MGMFDLQPPNEFDCKLQGSYQMQPGQTTTGLIATTIQATFSRQQAAPYAGPGAQVKAGGEFNADLVGLFDNFGNPVNIARPFVNNTWTGYTKWLVRGPSMPGGNFVDVGISASDGQISGGTYPFCRILLAAGPPVTTHHWTFENNGVVLGQVDIAEPENVIIRRDGVIVNLYYPH